MLRLRSVLALVAIAVGCSWIFEGTVGAQDAKPKAVSDAASKWVGTWQDTSEELPDLEIRLQRDALRIRMLDPELNDEGDDRLHLLTEMEGDRTAGAFATIQSDEIDVHLVFEFDGDGLQVQTIQIVQGESGGPHRVARSTYVRSADRVAGADNQSAPMKRRGSDSVANKPKGADAEKSKLGRIAGEISTRSTLRGTIRLTPSDKETVLPKTIRPADGVVRIAGTNPKFDFTGLPRGKYDLHFEGTINGVSRSVDWKGVETDPETADPSLSLSLKRGNGNP